MKQNTIEIKKVENNIVKIDGLFKYKSLKYRLEATWDVRTQRMGLIHSTVIAQRNILFDKYLDPGRNSVSVFSKYGNSINGINDLFMSIDVSNNIRFVSGVADGRRLVPLRIEGATCSCSSADTKEQFLVFVSDREVEPLGFTFEDKKSKLELEGLANVIDKTTIAFMLKPDNIFDGIGDILHGLRCVVNCITSWFQCLSSCIGFCYLCDPFFDFCLANCTFSDPFGAVQ